MVFGHYTLNIKSIPQNELPPNLQGDPSVSFYCGVRVFHILWIPIFPFAKIWLMEKGGEKYKVNNEVTRLFDHQYGRPKTPVYAFSGIILVVILIGLMKFKDSQKQKQYAQASAARYEANLNKQHTFIDDPSVNDYYVFKSEGGKYYVAKVDSLLNDSLSLKYFKSEKGRTGISESSAPYFFVFDEEPASSIILAKSDLSAAMVPGRDQPAERKMTIKDWAFNKEMQIENIFRIAPEEIKVQKNDETVKLEVTSAIKVFLSDPGIEPSLEALDESSKEYLLELIDVAKMSSGEEIKNYIENSEHPSPNYSLVMHAKYSYLKSTANEKSKNDQDLLVDWGFYAKLLDMGLWSIDIKPEDVDVNDVYLTGKNTALASLNKRPNVVDGKSLISFKVKLNKEDGTWKLNLPSTWSYTENQIASVSYNRTEAHKQWRLRVVSELMQLDDKSQIDFILKY